MGLSLCLPSHFRRGLRSHLLSSFRRGTASSPIQREGQVHASPPDPGEGQAHATPVRRAFRLLHHPEGSCLRLIRQALPAASFPALLSPGGSQIQVSTDHRCLSPRSDPHFPCTREAPTSTAHKHRPGWYGYLLARLPSTSSPPRSAVSFLLAHRPTSHPPVGHTRCRSP